MTVFSKAKKFLSEQNCDYLYVNHTNAFFSEYVDVSKSSRYLLTGFSGSMGDAIVSKDKIYLFADSRYWEQAELETDPKLVEVVKIGAKLNFEEALILKLKQKSKILMYQDKTSFQLYERLSQMGFRIKLTDVDIVREIKKTVPTVLKKDFQKIPVSLTGRSEEQKIKKLQNKLKDNEIAIISSLEDVSYLLNLKSSNFEYSSTVFGKIIIEKSHYEFFTDERAFEKRIKEISKRNVTFMIDKSTLSIKYKKYFKKYESAKFLSALRSIKYNAEIEHLKRCFERTDKVLNAVFKEFQKKDFKEEELFKFTNEKFKEYGAETNSFKTILASGKNSSIVHFSHPTNRKINKGEFVLLDCGGFYEGGYATDITRTFLKGTPSKEQKLIYTTVLKAFLRAYNADLSKYKTCYEIDKIARDFLNKNAPEGFVFGHGLGHSVGRCVHDGLPTVSPSPLAKMKIKKNMVFTIEPGLYKPDWGGVRLENTTHITEEKGKLKIRSFSKAPFQKSLIDFSLLTNKEKQYLKEWELI